MKAIISTTIYQAPNRKEQLRLGLVIKFWLIRGNDSPSPGTYNIPSDFDPKRKGKVFSFRWGWKAYSKVYQKEGFKNTLAADPNVPGPGTYKNFPSFGTEAKKVTLKGKFHDSPSNGGTPGPGSYTDLSSFPKTGRHFYSKFKSLSSWKIGPPTERFKDDTKKARDMPGPGQYLLKTSLSRTGHLLYRSERETMKLPKSDRYGPGPGSYLLPSDFGYPTDLKRTKRKKNSKLAL